MSNAEHVYEKMSMIFLTGTRSGGWGLRRMARSAGSFLVIVLSFFAFLRLLSNLNEGSSLCCPSSSPLPCRDICQRRHEGDHVVVPDASDAVDVSGPRVAVCIVGQLRFGACPWVQRSQTERFGKLFDGAGGRSTDLFFVVNPQDDSPSPWAWGTGKKT